LLVHADIEVSTRTNIVSPSLPLLLLLLLLSLLLM
jgi:hypothetical protein